MVSHNITIPAQLTCDGRVRQVSIVSLTDTACRLGDRLGRSAGGPRGDRAELWLGAVGPLRVRLPSGDLEELDFDGPIHPSIVAHFNA